MKPGRELGSLLAVLGAVVAAMALAAIIHPSREAAKGSSPSLARTTVAALPAVAERVERIRGLRFDSVPRPRVISASRFRRLSERDAARAGVARELATGSVVAKLLGLVPADADLSGLAGDTAGLAAAAYDPRRGRLYVIGDAVPGSRALTEFVLAHELTHALEDQRFGLDEPSPASDDGALAELSLVEGTATTVMSEYGSRYLNPFDLASSALGLDAGTGGVPDFLVEQLLFAYFRGGTFVESLYGAAAGWNVVDIALRDRPPASTEQVLHPRKYLLDERALAVAGIAAPAPGWRRVDSGVLGEFATGQLLRLGVPDEASRRAAAGWGGDRYLLFGRDGRDPDCANERACRSDWALVLRWRWDSARDRSEFLPALRRYAGEGLAGEASEADKWRLGGGWAAAAADGDGVTLALAPSRALASRLAASG